MNLTVGSRGSKLALLQTDIVTSALKIAEPDLKIRVRIIKTTGDRLASKPLLTIKSKGIFEKEIDEAVVNGDIDFAVHSMKDIPAVKPGGLDIVAVPLRAPANDVLLSKNGLTLRKLPNRALLGTSSPRRVAQALSVRPDLRVETLRGNVETRVQKMERGLYDAIILAESGLTRLELKGKIVERLDVNTFTPAPGQGALAVVAKTKSSIQRILRKINHWPSMAETFAERAFLAKLGGGCKVPVGAIGRYNKGRLALLGTVLSPDGQIRISKKTTGKARDFKSIGERLAIELLNSGASTLIEEWRNKSG